MTTFLGMKQKNKLLLLSPATQHRYLALLLPSDLKSNPLSFPRGGNLLLARPTPQVTPFLSLSLITPNKSGFNLTLYTNINTLPQDQTLAYPILVIPLELNKIVPLSPQQLCYSRPKTWFQHQYPAQPGKTMPLLWKVSEVWKTHQGISPLASWHRSPKSFYNIFLIKGRRTVTIFNIQLPCGIEVHPSDKGLDPPADPRWRSN